jgi:RES domain-containing protein
LNVEDCQRLRRTNVDGTWFRAVLPQYLKKVLSSEHTRTTSSRFYSVTEDKRRRFEILYLAENPKVALFEVGALFGSPRKTVDVRVDPDACFTVVPVTADLSDIADLTDPEQAVLLQTNAQELTGDWRTYAQRGQPGGGHPSPHAGIAPTQQLGMALYHVESAGKAIFKGFLSFSATCPELRILGVFTERLRQSSSNLKYTYRDDEGRDHRTQIPA